MKQTKLEQNWDYAHWTYMTGARTFQGVEMVLSNMVDNFKEVTSHPCGSFSDTKDAIARNAISDIAIVMSHSLLEGFFHEEFEFYLKEKMNKKPGELSALISTLLHAHNISIKDWRERKKVVDLVTTLRNAVVHSNGIINCSIDKAKCEELLGEDVFGLSDSYPTLSPVGSLRLLRKFRNIADDYSREVFNKASERGN